MIDVNARVADLASTSNGKGASTIGIEDAAAQFTATTVEAALLEIDGRIDTVKAETSVVLARVHAPSAALRARTRHRAAEPGGVGQHGVQV